MFDEDDLIVDAIAPLRCVEAWEELDYYTPAERGDLFRWLSEVQAVELAQTRADTARALVGMD